MHRKIIGIFVCTLLTATTIPITGQVTKSIISKDTDEINPLSNGDKWMKTFGGFHVDVGRSVLQTSDGGYIVCGDTFSYGSGEEDIWLIKTDSNGNKIWCKLYGGGSADLGLSIQHTNDDCYIIVGYTLSYGSGGSDVWLIKIDADGNKLWDKTYGGEHFDRGYDVKQTIDGGFIIIGSTPSNDGRDRNIWLVKTDADGNKLWDKKFGGDGSDVGESVHQIENGDFILFGFTSSYGSGDFDYWLIKTDSNGELLWDKTFGGTGIDMGHSVQITNDGGYILAGETEKGNKNYDICLIKTDSNGELIWENTYGGFGWDRGLSVQQTMDGGYIICGDGPPNLLNNFDAMLIKTNSNGEEEWIKHYGGMSVDSALSVKQTNDGGYIFSGYESSGLYYDLWLVKTDSNGDVPMSRARNLMESRFFELFPNLFSILQTLLYRLGIYEKLQLGGL